ncbi:MAG: hypothetical protein AAGD32_17035 [Planctomycetota bacterium]
MREWKHNIIDPAKIDQHRELLDFRIAEIYFNSTNANRSACLEFMLAEEFGTAMCGWRQHSLLVGAQLRRSVWSKAFRMSCNGQYQRAAILAYRSYDRHLISGGTYEDIQFAACLRRLDPTIDIFLDQDQMTRLGYESFRQDAVTPTLNSEIATWRRNWRTAWRNGLVVRYRHPEIDDHSGNLPESYISWRGSWLRHSNGVAA